MTKEINPQAFGKVAVLMGGLYGEREISLISGDAVLQAFGRSGVDATAIDVGHDVCARLMAEKFDRAFVALHGRGGEDGSIQGMLDCLNIPYTGSGVAASAISMDKPRCKWIWQGLSLPTPPFMVIDVNTSPQEIMNNLGLPLAIKPVCEGSSLGVSKVVAVEQLEEACKLALSFSPTAIAERWIEGKELTVGILAEQALPVIHIVPPNGIYDYEAKYFSEETQYNIPSGLTDVEEHELQQLALKAFKVLGGRHWGRIDVIQDHYGQFWLLELNTIPGLTSHSLVPKAAQAIGIDFDQLMLRILEQTL